MTKNAYIHIPFCKSKCKYCSFLSFPKPEMIKSYLQALKNEIENLYSGEPLDTLYFGGGTPSLLSAKDFSQINELFNIKDKTEITAELNPEGVDQKYLNKLIKTGVNRLSFGCQTFDDKILKYIGRIHNANDVKNAVKASQNAGFSNISLDFIYGLPFQTTKMFEKDLIDAIELNIKHISLYGLKIEPECYFYKNPPENLPDDDTQAEMYLTAINTLKKYDFKQYEISNFSITGYESKHNLNYWNNNTYYGFGLGAHGYQNNTRYANEESLEKYIQNPLKHKTEKFLSQKEMLEEEIFLGFRKSEGINKFKINEIYKIDFDKKYNNILKKYKNYIKKTVTGYKLTTEGLLISNIILAEFID